MRVFLDANVLFSAAKSDGAVRRLLALLLAEGHVLCADSYVVAEARRNLQTKGRASLDVFDGLLERLELSEGQAPSGATPPVLVLPEKDRPVLRAAVWMRCQALVTGDKAHFGRFYGRALEAVAIHSPRSLAEALLI